MRTPYSQNDRNILMRWQVAKVRSDWRVLAPPGIDGVELPEDKTIQRQYYAARDPLQGLADPELLALGKTAHPEGPCPAVSAPGGYRQWGPVAIHKDHG